MTSNLQLQLSVPSGNIESYLSGIHNIPVLTKKEEIALAVRLRDDNDLDAAQSLVFSNLRFVAHIARSYSGYGLALADLVQEGNIGLMKAVKRFDPSKNVRLVSFAVHWIRAEMHEFILKNWRIVKVATTKAQRKLFFNLRKSKQKLAWFTDEEVGSVARDLGVSKKDVLEMESRLTGSDIEFENKDSDDDEHFAPAAYLKDMRHEPSRLIENHMTATQNKKQLLDAIKTLDERSKSIIQRRWLTEDKVTLQSLANEYNISAERVRQLENAAMKKLRLAINID
ncbi:RNA polymerase sigma factor RpoH [hydrothermal vent metagenome]|uniref:RNA polymerase sigma factor RpoH n=1 Tax=hydrothermal vent metagenome TaxID=652676 RepID=A0A3B1A735_9ZZZZ